MRKRFLTPLLLALIVIGFFWKLTLSSQYTWLESPDLAYQVMPWQQVQAAAIHQGKLPLWDPYLWGGQSLIGQASPGLAYPLNWLLYVLPLRDGHVRRGFLDWYFVLIHVQAALFAFWLCRDLGRSPTASLIAGAAFALGGAVGTTDWPQILNGIVWLPAIFMFFLRAIRGNRPLLSSALCGFVLGIAWLSGHHQVPLFYSVAMGGLWTFYIFHNGVQWRIAKLAAVFVAFLALTSALQVLPAFQYGHLATRWVGAPDAVTWNQIVPYSVHQDNSLGLSTLFGIFIPGMEHYAVPYMGFLILSLAAIGVALFWNEPTVRILSVLAMAGLFFSLGFQNVLHGFLYALVPMIEKAREPAMAVVVFNFGAAILTAYGFDGLRDQKQSAWIRRVAQWLLAIGALIVAVLLTVLLIKKLQFDLDDRSVLSGIAALIAGGLYLAYRRGNLSFKWLTTACVLLMLMELGNSTTYNYIHRLDQKHAIYLRNFSENTDIVQWVRTQPGRFRIQMNSDDIPFNYGDWYGVDVFQGYLASLPTSLVRFDVGAYRTRMLYGVKYWIGRTPRDPDQVAVFAGRSGLKVYQSPGAFPRVWTVHRIGDASEAATFDPRTTALVTGTPPAVDTCAGDDSVSLAKWDFDTVVIEAQMACRGLVILSDNYYPGWSATVDGQPAPIWNVDTVVRGVETGPGTHHIEMHYHSWPVDLGAILLVISIAGLIALARFERKLPTG